MKIVVMDKNNSGGGPDDEEVLISRDLLAEKVAALVARQERQDDPALLPLAYQVLLDNLPNSWPEKLVGYRAPFRPLSSWGGGRDHETFEVLHLDGNAKTKHEVTTRIQKAQLADEKHFLDVLGELTVLGRRSRKAHCPGYAAWEKDTPFELCTHPDRQRRWEKRFEGLGNIYQRLRFRLPSKIRQMQDRVPDYELRVSKFELRDEPMSVMDSVIELIEDEVVTTLQNLSGMLEEDDLDIQGQLPLRLKLVFPKHGHAWREIARVLGHRLVARAEVENVWFSSVVSVVVNKEARVIRPPLARRRDALSPGDEFLVLQSEFDGHQLATNGLLYSKRLYERADQFVELVRASPDDILKTFGVKREDLRVFNTYFSYRAFLQRVARESSFSEQFERLEDAVEILDEAIYCAGLPKPSNKLPSHVLRILVDAATSAQFAAAVPRSQCFDEFLDLATGQGTNVLAALPKRIRVAKSLAQAEPLIGRWAERNGITVTHPASGGDAGVHHIKQWRADLASATAAKEQYCSSERGITVEELVVWVSDHNAVIAGDQDYTPGHYAGAASVDMARFRAWRISLATSRQVD